MKNILVLSSLFFTFYSHSQDISKELEVIRSEYSLPSLSGATVKKGEMIISGVTGIRKIGFSNKVELGDKHHLGSCSKSITALLAAKLIDLKLLSWKSKLSELLPDIQMHEELKNVEFELLFVHRSGLVENLEYFSKEWIEEHLQNKKYSARVSRSFLANAVLTHKPKYQARVDDKYSNMGYMIAAHILENLTNSSFEDLLKKYIFKPLKMTSCGVGLATNPALKDPLQPWGHYLDEDNLKPVHDDNPPAYGPAGAIFCSLKDWGKYLSLHIEGFNNRGQFLSKENFAKLYEKYPAKDNNYTFGGWNRLERKWSNGDVLQHTGTNTFNYANVWVAPHIETALMSTINAYRGFKATDSAIALMIKKLKTP